MHCSSRYSTVICVATIALVCCSGDLQEPPLAGTVITERPSPDKNLLARVIATGSEGTYTLKVQDVGKDDVIAERTIAAPVGYHEHIISLTWSEDSRTVKATIDHDFGENNRGFDLQIDHRDD